MFVLGRSRSARTITVVRVLPAFGVCDRVPFRRPVSGTVAEFGSLLCLRAGVCAVPSLTLAGVSWSMSVFSPATCLTCAVSQLLLCSLALGSAAASAAENDARVLVRQPHGCRWQCASEVLRTCGGPGYWPLLAPLEA